MRRPAPAAVAVMPTVVTSAPMAEGVSAIAAIMTAQPPLTQAARGAIQGVVTRAGSSEPIPGATVAIVDAPFDPEALKALLGFWAARGLTMDPPTPGQSEEKFFQTLMDNLAAKGISATLPENQLALAGFRAMNTAKYSAVADANGRFAIKDVPAGQYHVEADREGFSRRGAADEAIADVEAGKSADNQFRPDRATLQ